MFEEELKIAKATLDLVKEELQARIDAKSIKPEEFPLYGKVVSKAQSDVKYYEELRATYKTEA